MRGPRLDRPPAGPRQAPTAGASFQDGEAMPGDRMAATLSDPRGRPRSGWSALVRCWQERRGAPTNPADLVDRAAWPCGRPARASPEFRTWKQGKGPSPTLSERVPFANVKTASLTETSCAPSQRQIGNWSLRGTRRLTSGLPKARDDFAFRFLAYPQPVEGSKIF